MLFISIKINNDAVLINASRPLASLAGRRYLIHTFQNLCHAVFTVSNACRFLCFLDSSFPHVDFRFQVENLNKNIKVKKVKIILREVLFGEIGSI